VFAWHWALDILGLATLAVSGQDEAPGDLIGALRSPVAADEVQAQVQSGGTTGGRQDTALVDVEHVGDKPQAGVAADKLVGVLPVRGGVAAIEEAGGRQHERAGAQRHDAGAGGMGVAEPGAQGIRHRGVGAAPAGDDDSAGLG
jgi:hypothetical protein